MKVGAEFKRLAGFYCSSPRLQALHELGLSEGARWLTGELETVEAVMEQRAPLIPDGYAEAELRLLLQIGRLPPLEEW